ncbi:hypothetical protein [Enterovirga rhinocerotis]|uniref:Uncharacterized protein n=1 Tax=Enterovirga rhinocerotis TaxID=1339210 RepID=A0A4R7BTN4_9HYPH|nr:hypothetical protein [Enterovirga rhinocerotis]TDR89104.1 hypothetical protein EV668_3592 [Enterovirga rhinocerotis]
MSASPDADRRLLEEYGNWLSIERHRVVEALGLEPRRDFISLHGPAFEWHQHHPGEACRRAATVLDAVGVDWRAA